MEQEVREILDKLGKESQLERALAMSLIVVGEAIGVLLSSGDMERLKAFKYQCAQLFFAAEQAAAQHKAGMN